jgi:hypothetical protein
MTNRVLTGLLIFGLTTLLPANSHAQVKGVLVLPESSVTIQGTSSLHNWEVFIKDFKVDFVLKTTDNEKISIENLKAVFKGASVTSDNSIMTSKAKDALRVKDEPEIIFTTEGAEDIVLNDGKAKQTVNGELVIAGLERNFSVTFTGSISGDTFTVSGSNTISMKDFQITPPTALLGTLKTGDLVTVDFNLKFRLAQ